jgi:hypothetical protein
MSAKVKIKFVAGRKKGQEFTFLEHDTFLFGRADDCHVCLSKDERVSRHHFLLEVNPPNIRLRDLGSMNGTYVNDVKYGGWSEEEEASISSSVKMPFEVDLGDGDEIRVGKNVILVNVEKDLHKAIIRCEKCGAEVSDGFNEGVSGEILCEKCRNKQKPKRVDEQETQFKPGSEPILPDLLEAEPMQSITDELGLTDYREIKVLGQGGMGIVYLVQNKRTDEFSALKVMLAQIAVSENARKQFAREIQTCRELKHNHVVNFLGYGSHGGVFYFFMEYCDAGSIESFRKQRGGRLLIEEAIPFMLQVLDGLAYLHSKDLVHRDLKPQNILLKKINGILTAKIADYGLAKNFTNAGWSGFTITGGFGGSLAYMPREQVSQFKYVYPSSDIWSIGATFYHMLTNQFPRDAENPEAMLAAMFTKQIIPIRQRDSSIKRSIADVIDRALLEDPEQRFANAGEMLQAMKKAI